MTKVSALLGSMLVAALLLLATPTSGTATPNCTAEQGQAFIDAGNYTKAVSEFTCVIDAQPTAVAGYRGRIEAELMLGRFSDAVRDYTRVFAVVEPVHPDARVTIYDGYAARLAVAPDNVPALTGASFARWSYFDYPQAINVLDTLLQVKPDDVYGTLFRGSSRLLKGVANKSRGVADLERALALAPDSPDVHYVVADAYTYGLPDPARAYAEATAAFDGGLDTPRVHAILGAALNSFGDTEAAALQVQQHLDLVTTDLVPAAPLAARNSVTLDLVPGRTYEIPLTVTAGETLSIATSSHDYWDTIALLLGPDGSPVLGSDDVNAYFAAFDYVAPQSGTYLLHVTFFESASTGELLVTRR